MASIQKRGKTYRVRVTRKDYPTLSNTFKTRGEALKWARDVEHKIDDGQIHPKNSRTNRTVGKISFAEAAHHYGKVHTPLKRNFRSETLIIKALIRRFNDLPVNKIGQPEVCSLRDEMLSAGRSGTTIAHYFNTISKIYQMLSDEWGLQIRNPVLGVKRPPQNPPRVVRLSREAIDALLNACREASEPKLLSIVQIALETAMRRNEILKLAWRDIDFEQRRIHVNQTKNGYSRCIPATQRVLHILKEIQPNQTDMIFCLSAESMRKHYERAVKRARESWIDNSNNPFINLTFHDLRHKALSVLSDRGLNVVELAEISGHKTIGMLRRYTHPSHAAILAKLN